MSEFVIRVAAPRDAEVMARLSGELGYPSSPQEMTDRLGHVLSDDDHHALVAVSDDEVVGWVHVFGAHRLDRRRPRRVVFAALCNLQRNLQDAQKHKSTY